MRSIFKILKFSGHLWRYYLAIGLLSLTVAMLGQVMPLITRELIDGFSSGSLVRNSALLLVLAIFIADIAQTLLNNVNGYFGDQLSLKISNFLSDKFYEKILKLPQNYFDQELTGTIVSKLNRSTTGLAAFMQAFSNNLLGFIATTVFSLFFIFSISWVVGLVLLAIYPVYILMTVRSSGTWQNYENQKNELKDIAAGRFQEAISNIKTIKSFASEDSEHKYFNSTLEKLTPIHKKQSIFWNRKDVERKVVVNIIFGLVFIAIVQQLYSGAITIGDTVALIQFSLLVRVPIFMISYLVSQLQAATASSRDYFITLDQVEEDRSATEIIDKINGEIKFNNVEFSYKKGESVFKNINFEVKPGQKVALVGESGQGKSTLAHLLLKLYHPSSGTILLDGHDLNNLETVSLRKQIGLVLQEPALFSGTITENIAYGKPKASKKQVMEAAKAANADGFISKFKDGYNSYIGERGVKLSGGQKQRVAIARTILKDAPILILDEATSSLDSKAEKEVQIALDNLMHNKTTIIIAHRLSTISGADLIVTLKNGQIDEVGSPKELAKTGGVYSELLELQNSGTKEAKKKLEKFDIG
ncbi:MAG: ABC transporter ATP-binding protein [Candidatus Nomurabacteria bacterium]|nr:MAG: ABC transporter ATP-binding protein [Candidatus Nomurabacteria bacterium]